MKSHAAIIIGAIITTQQSVEAFQPSVSSRRAILSNIATSSAVVLLLPNIASAATREPNKAGKKELLRGGKNASDALHTHQQIHHPLHVTMGLI